MEEESQGTGSGWAHYLIYIVIFMIGVAAIKYGLDLQRSSSSSAAGQSLSDPPPRLREAINIDQLASRMVRDQDLYRTIRDEAYASYRQLHPGTHSYDAKARTILGIMAYVWIWQDYYGEGLLDEALFYYHQALDEGMDMDPLFEALKDIHIYAKRRPDSAEKALKMNDRCLALEATSYPVCFKFWANSTVARGIARGMERKMENFESAAIQMPEITRRILGQYEIMVRAHYPEGILYTIADDYMCDMQDDEASLVKAGRVLDEIWAQHHPDHPIRFGLQGSYYVSYAWCARTSQWASKVTPEGWELMEIRLKKAQEILEPAYSRFPQDGGIPLVMLRVILGDAKGGQEELDLWFQRAVQTNPKSRLAYLRKAHYLLPRWHGSQDEELAFGRECLSTQKWETKVPMMLVDYLDWYRKDFDDQFYVENWGLLQEIFDGTLKRYPQSRYYRSLYAKFATKAQQWKIANRQFEILGYNWDQEVMDSENFKKLRQEVANNLR